MGIGKKLSELIEQKGTNPNELADRVGITPSTIYSIIKRDNTKVDIEVLIRICEALDVNVEVFYQEYLKRKTSMKMPPLFVSKYYQLDDFGRDLVDTVLNKEYARCTSEREEPKLSVTTTIRMHLNRASAGMGYDLSNHDEWKKITVVKDRCAESADFAVEIEGDSMLPDYKDGDIVYIVLDEDVPVGKVGLFRQNGRGYIKERGEDRLISRNPDYPDIFPEDGEIVCIGRVIGVAERVS